MLTNRFGEGPTDGIQRKEGYLNMDWGWKTNILWKVSRWICLHTCHGRLVLLWLVIMYYRYALYPKSFDKISQFIPNKVCVYCTCTFACVFMCSSYTLCQYNDLSATYRLLLTAYNSTICQRKKRTTRIMLPRSRNRREKLPCWLVNNWYVSICPFNNMSFICLFVSNMEGLTCAYCTFCHRI